MNLTKPLFMLLILISLTFSQLYNDHVNQLIQESVTSESVDCDSAKNAVQSMLDRFRIEIYREKETEDFYNQFEFLSKLVLIKLDSDYQNINFELDNFNYPSLTFPEMLMHGRNVTVRASIKTHILNGETMPNGSLWKDSKNYFYRFEEPNRYAVTSIAFKKVWNFNPGYGVCDIQMVKCDYLYNITATQNVWSSPVQYNVDDLVIHHGKVYKCVFAHTSQINIMPGEPMIWYWEEVADVQPDFFHITFHNFKLDNNIP